GDRRPSRPTLSRLGALSGGGALAHHRLRLGYQRAGRRHREEPDDGDGHLRRAPVRRLRARPVDHGAPRRPPGLSDELRGRARKPRRALPGHRLQRRRRRGRILRRRDPLPAAMSAAATPVAGIDLSGVFAEWGYLAIAMLLLLGNVGLPVPEETVLIWCGY